MAQGPQASGGQRVVLEFDPDDPVSGVMRLGDDGLPAPFSGWLDLLRLLEAAVAGWEITGADPRVPDDG